MKLDTKDEMKTADEMKREFDKSSVNGIRCLKTLIKEKHELVQKKTEYAEDLERQVTKRKSDYEAAIQSQTSMRQQVTDIEDRLEQIEKKKRELTKRLDEKMEILREVNSYKESPSINDATHAERRLARNKKVLKDNTDKFNKARAKKKDLETRLHLVECKSNAMISKVSYLKTELYHANLKHGRVDQERKQLEELKAQCATKCGEFEEGIDTDRSKLDAEKHRVITLQESIERKEDEILSMGLSRKKLEDTIRNILMKIKEQHEKNRYIDVAYTLNKDSFVS